MSEREGLISEIKAVFRWYMPKDENWYRIVKAFSIISIIIGTAIYILGSSEPSISRIANLIWKASAFGVFSDGAPYICRTYPEELCSYYEMSAGRTGEIRIYLLLAFVVTCLISIRLLCLCIELLDKSLGINLISRLLDKFLPEKSHPGFQSGNDEDRKSAVNTNPKTD